MKINENEIEIFTIDLLKNAGYQYLFGPDIAPDGERPERQLYADVVLKNRLQKAINSINPGIPYEAREQAMREVLNISSPDLINNNEIFHKYFTDGVEVEYQKEGITRGDKVKLVDFDEPDFNDFLVVNQFTIIEDNINKRPDIILFVNGMPLVVMELKNPADENATLRSAYQQLQTYKSTIPSLFTYNGLLVISDGSDAQAGALSAGYQRFSAWKTRDGKVEASTLTNQLEILIEGLLNKNTLLDLVRYFTVFEHTKDENKKITKVHKIKKIAAYHQYYAVNKAIESTIRASGYDLKNETHENPEKYGYPSTEKQTSGDRKGGVVWHTQGSGKSLSMVFFTGKLVLMLENPTIVVLTDRNDLDGQLFDTFASSRQLLRQEPKQAENREHLKELLKVAHGGIVFSTIQKFSPDNHEAIYPTLSDRENIVVIADEAHRSQYGFKAKEVDILDEKGNVTGKRTVYGFAKYIRDALPNATFVGFTGTPVELKDKNTPAVFGNYVDIYDIAQAVEDGATVKIFYDSRIAKVDISEEGKQLIEELDEDLKYEDMEITQQAKVKWTKLEAIVGSNPRVKAIAKDIVTHFEKRQEVFMGKALVVAMSRANAIKLYNQIIKLRPDWHHDDLHKGAIKIVMTTSSSDGEEFEKHRTTKTQRKILAKRLKDLDDPLKMVIVVDMWLTGFDVPCLHTMYIDKPMRGHNLMQAIARVNRVFRDKPGGLIVDYLGILSDLKKALSFYLDSGGKGEPTNKLDDAINLMLQKLEIIDYMFSDFDYSEYFEAKMSRKLDMILEAVEYILMMDNGKDRFLKEVTALSKAFSLSVPADEAMAVKEKVSFFQAVKARINKLTPTTTGKSNEEIETAIKQVIDKAIVSDKVVDIYEEAGVDKPDISILSEEFINELKGYKHKNVAIELLKKLLNDEIQTRRKVNLVQSKKLQEMLENTIRKYRNKLLTSAEVIEELLNIAKETSAADKRGEDLGLTNHELAFYDALAQNQSAQDVLGKDTLREMAIVLVDRVRKNATIDWNIKENVRAKMRVTVKRLLREYGYPPDLQKLATETVLQQAKLFTEFEVGENT
ncbi:MAG: type I restriction endonuclease subunit R [Fidelibacterota bacterium]